MAHGSYRLYEFGPYQVDPQKLQLWRHGTAVALPPKAAEILLVLVARDGETVSKEDLMRSVWPDSYVEESNLTQNIFLLRKALGETAHQSSYIITIPGKGYRLAAEVRAIGAESSPSPAVPVSEESAAAPPQPERRARSSWLWVAAVGLLAIAVAGGFLWRRHPTRAQAPAGRVMLAVLPFENLTGDAAQDYFSDGMTEEMIAQLGDLDPEHLGVIARTSVMHYKNGRAPLDQIGRELGVQYALEGSVRRDANRVRITAQLIQMKDQSHLWSRRYDRELSNTLTLESEVAREIADEIQVSLGQHTMARAAEPVQSPAPSYEAYDLYLRGRYFWNKRNPEGFLEAIGYFQQAVARDPGYARAYAGLADCYVLLPEFTGAPPAQFLEKAREAANQALQLDDGLAEAHTSLALITENYDWNWPAAGREYRRAIALNPNYATAHQWYAEYLAWQGRFDEASRESERARELDPLSLIIASDDAMILYYARQYDRAEARFKSVLDMDPNFSTAHRVREVYVQEGRFDLALADIGEGRSLHGFPWYWSGRAYVLGRAGREAEAREAIDQLLRLNRQKELEPAGIAWAYAGIRDADHTLFWLNRAMARRSNTMTALKVEPGYDFLRSDPRFQDLVRRVGLDDAGHEGR